MLSLEDTTVLSTDRLKKTGEEYQLVLLSPKNIDDILALQEAAFAGMEHPSYLHRKSREFFEKHFAAGNDVIGVVHNGNLIAQSVIVNPTESYPDLGMPMKLDNVPLTSLTCLQGVIVDPAYQGNNLMSVMVDAWLASSKQKGRTEAFADVILSNSYSWSVFMNNGMHIESIAIDPITQSEVYNLHGNVSKLRKTFNHKRKKSVIVPQSDIDTQKELLDAGYKGAKFDRGNGNLEFHRPRKHVHHLGS